MARRLLILNGLAAFILPMFHAVVFGFQAMFLWTDRYQPVAVPNYDQLGSLSYYVMLIIRQLSGFSIPAFLFVTGFFIAFLASGSQTQINKEALIKRIKVLIIPFLTWTIIHFLLLMRLPDSVGELLRPYYYIPLVIQYYLLSPILVYLCRKNWKLLFAAVFLLHILLLSTEYMAAFQIDLPGRALLMRLTPIWFFPQRLFWFVFGFIVSQRLGEVKPWLARFKGMFLGSMFLFGALSVLEYVAVNNLVSPNEWLGTNFNGFGRELFAVSVLLTFIAYEKVHYPFKAGLSDLGVKSLGIYLVNAPAMYITSTLIYHFSPWLLGQSFLYQSILFLVGLAVPLLLMSITFKLPAVRPGFRYLFG